MASNTLSPIQSLPDEVLRMIFVYFTQAEISALRLLCRKFERVGIEPLLSSLHMTFRPKSFENLRSICKSSNLSPFVKHIVYEADILPSVSAECWSIAVQRFLASLDHAALEQVRASNSIFLYQDYQNEVSKIGLDATKNVDFVTLDLAFKQFSNIERVDLILGGRSEVCKPFQKSTTTTAAFEDIVLPPHFLLRQAGFYPTRHQSDLEKVCKSEYGVRQLKSVLLAVAASGAKLKDLNCGPFDWKFFHDRRPQVDGHENFAEAPALYLPAFANLVNLCLIIDEHSYKEQAGSAERLGNAIGAARNLKNLKVIFDYAPLYLFRFIPSCYVSWDSVTPKSTWQHLEEFTLENLAFSDEVFIDFLIRHAKTLKRMSFKNIYLTTNLDSGTPRFFAMFKRRIEEFVNLKDVSFEQKLKLKFRGVRYARVLDMDSGVQERARHCELFGITSYYIYTSARESQILSGTTTRFGYRITQFLLKDGENPFLAAELSE